MVLPGDYPRPVTVNGFTCKNCADVGQAQRHIDPQHPQSGPYNVNAAHDPTRKHAVTFGGVLEGLNGVSQSGAVAKTTGALVDFTA